MQYLTLEQAAMQPYQLQYRYRVWSTAILFIMDFALFAAATIQALLLWQKGELLAVALLGWCALWFGIFALILYNVLHNRLRPTNWLARVQTNGLLLKYRSYMNPMLPAEDAVAVFIAFSEMEWIRSHRVSRNIPGSVRGEDEQRFQKYAEIKLRADSRELETHLAAERQVQGQAIKTWYGNRRRAISRHYPVSLSTEGLLRVEWCVLPKLSRFMDDMKSLVAEGPALKSKTDYRKAESATPRQQEEMLLELLATGDRISAIRVARHLYKFDLTQAVQFVDELSSTKLPS